MIFGNSVWQLVSQSDTVSKGVLLILLIMSLICWVIFVYKVIMLRIKKRQMRHALAVLNTVQEFEHMVRVSSALSGTLPGIFLARAFANLNTVLKGDQPVSARGWEFVQNSTAQTLDDLVSNEESYLPFLATSAAVSPLLGLFGTVWGLVHAFIRISELQSADIVAVAPGIAEALITTLVGLIVAIPSLVMYNYLVVETRTLENQFIALSDRFHVIVHRLVDR